jgi:hypothetical protein
MRLLATPVELTPNALALRFNALALRFAWPSGDTTPPTPRPGEAPTPRWTDRARRRPDTVDSSARYGGYAGSPPRHRACDRPWPPRMPRSRPRSRRAERSQRSPQTAGEPHEADARHTTPRAGLSLRCHPHAARSPAHRTGGAPPRGMTPGHTSSCPQGGAPLRMDFASLGAHRLPVQTRWRLHRRLPEHHTADRQGLSMRVMVQPIAPHSACLRGWHMQEPPLENVPRGSGHALPEGAP